MSNSAAPLNLLVVALSTALISIQNSIIVRACFKVADRLCDQWSITSSTDDNRKHFFRFSHHDKFPPDQKKRKLTFLLRFFLSFLSFLEAFSTLAARPF